MECVAPSVKQATRRLQSCVLDLTYKLEKRFFSSETVWALSNQSQEKGDFLSIQTWNDLDALLFHSH
jgi:hypothetical protein